ncbi:hypothetical protein [Pseudoruegeria sp. SHC-113]|uniref:hypothetical protein n=1 Tax=Pseudoruegeria sp. SHC-113 TaxID=2855439 RepID=UPI0021BABD52|nr:hypothetical protein [Pseudoruegeria sp. SHC-113]MCT8158500.1 hypothetical protein [Pseudoruegeria sp. SHC-113]
MNKTFITLIAIVTLIVTSVNAGRARAADSDDIAKILLGATALFVIGSAIADANDDTPRRKAERPGPSPLPYTPYRDREQTWKPGKGTKLLPTSCLATFRGKDGTYRGYSRSCLRQSYRYENQLPKQCLKKVHTFRDGKRNVYEPSCLRRYGFWHQARN